MIYNICHGSVGSDRLFIKALDPIPELAEDKAAKNEI